MSPWHLLWLGPLAYDSFSRAWDRLGSAVDLRFAGGVPEWLSWPLFVPLVPRLVVGSLWESGADLWDEWKNRAQVGW